MHDSTKYDYSSKYGNKNVLLHLAVLESTSYDLSYPRRQVSTVNAIRTVVFRGEIHWESILYIDVNMDMRKKKKNKSPMKNNLKSLNSVFTIWLEQKPN